MLPNVRLTTTTISVKYTQNTLGNLRVERIVTGSLSRVQWFLQNMSRLSSNLYLFSYSHIWFPYVFSFQNGLDDISIMNGSHFMSINVKVGVAKCIGNPPLTKKFIKFHSSVMFSSHWVIGLDSNLDRS